VSKRFVSHTYTIKSSSSSSVYSSDEDSSDQELDMPPPEVLLDRELRRAEEITHVGG